MQSYTSDRAVFFNKTIGAYKVAAYEEEGRRDGSMILLTNHQSGDGSIILSYNGEKLSVYSTDGKYYVGVGNRSDTALRFFLVEIPGEGGVLLLSYWTGKCVRIDSEGYLRPDASQKEAEQFEFRV